ncbi:UDP-glucose 4-epimerase GalE [Leptospira sp. 2 VSF19]|uniref:UDP-glucose 4-epimerase n=1 Tax=Leptospira soteropolitanensis TaxID=2950025 RepID=A0AAW5VDX7_9LEPT|nr:UDP-glucose 4-epimerase GalE [Leptospira soteropolitanensis]MCW7491883.1 UDP-glucose 4-epimerase GalE [Leptospira soteropolitanensis]MCW7499467.1 UDP-glucose 4-epimerase GalE [Leptospira soteropolitanensis]MCW7520942.1 UDP-glucose 4-epimerase GalE [Leptospira soteropolitanensis]MCW7525571.1 UDP-glucose 4-epimerase GalE [Leptospira soteropolitanensis]MCW7529437.1 UDP-glucose 4-epimerase GalE [Leptospira soteropolitanensis]
MRILVTGGAGYIGSHIVLELMELGHEILIVDDMEKGNEANLFPGNEFIKGEIQNPEILKQAFAKKIDAVFHFAAWKAAGESMTDPLKYTMNNLNGTFTLLDAMVKYGCQYIVFSSSAAVYGAPKYLPIDEKHPLNPENYYGYTKLCIEENLEWFDKLKGLKSARLRYFNAAGYDPKGRIKGIEKTPANLLPIIMEVASGIRNGYEIFGTDYETEDGTCVRDYIHVSDLAKAHVLALNYIMSKNESLTVNLGSESGYSVKEMADLSEKVVGKTIPHKTGPRRAGDPAKLLASSAKARELLNWKPVYSDAETLLSSMWNLYKNL